ncbi:MAG: phosphatase PAP2 family protein [Candidatus Aenigmarchaeota archaeon]|nr:phosphatase PAP2 family protein [Candidatus Aenigmarchaeota archaeon]
MPIETSILLFMNGSVPLGALDYVLALSESIYLLLAVALVYGFQKRKLKGAVWVLLVLVLVYAVTGAMKVSFAEPRPVLLIDGVQAFVAETTPSFPSAHSSLAFAAAAILATPIAYLWAALIALSRVVLGVHFPHDIIFGALLGHALSKILYNPKMFALFAKKNLLETRRQVFHAFFGIILAFTIYFNDRQTYVLLFALMLFSSAALSYSIKKQMRLPWVSWILKTFEREKDIIDWPLRGPVFFIIGALLASLFFSKEVAFVSVLMLAVGDSASTLIGRPLGSRKHLHNPCKTIEGTIAGSFAAYIAAAFFVPLNMAVIGALAFGIVESFDFRGRHIYFDDNIIVPLAVGLVISLI